jgi:hypothetical protein
LKRSTILRTTGLVLLAAAAVTAIGALVVRDQIERHQRDLFSARPLKRLAALGYIAGLAATVELARTLRDFIAWEDRSMLRRRAEVILDRMEGDLERAASAARTTQGSDVPLRGVRTVYPPRASARTSAAGPNHQPGIAG